MINLNHFLKIGGPKKVVQADESAIFRAKFVLNPSAECDKITELLGL